MVHPSTGVQGTAAGRRPAGAVGRFSGLPAGRLDHRDDAGLGLVIQGHRAGFQPAGQRAVNVRFCVGIAPKCAGFCAALDKNPRVSLRILRKFVSLGGA